MSCFKTSFWILLDVCLLSERLDACDNGLEFVDDRGDFKLLSVEISEMSEFPLLFQTKLNQTVRVLSCL